MSSENPSPSTSTSSERGVPVSVILPVYNAVEWLPDCLDSILRQSYPGPLELSVYNDGSTDASLETIELWRDTKFLEKDIKIVISGHTGEPKGVGFAKNRAISQSSGRYLCFLDADDVMHQDRILRQYEAAQTNPKTIIGSKFHREPAKSTERYTQWANYLSKEQLYLQAYMSHGPTVIMPTWFCDREVISELGGFDETGKGTPEDLILFYKHLRNGGNLLRVNHSLLMYRYHPNAETFSIKEETIWSHRIQFLEERILSQWPKFSIWNAGKQGRRFYRSLSLANQKKVYTFCDVDNNKIKKRFYIYEQSEETPKPKVPIVHFLDVEPPVIICLKLGLCGDFMNNLKLLNFEEGRDYIHFN